jgi:hypothetical protein
MFLSQVLPLLANIAQNFIMLVVLLVLQGCGIGQGFSNPR